MTPKKKSKLKTEEPPSDRCTLTINKEQARIMCEALEIYSRLKHGQISELRELFRDRWCAPDSPFNWSTEPLLDSLKAVIFPELPKNAYHGVGSKIYPESSVAWDIMQVIRHRLAWDRLKAEGRDQPEYWGVQYNPPMRFGSEPLAHIEVLP
jgi:hypothetical protein